MDVATDTNALALDWWLSGVGSELSRYLRTSRSKLILHEVVWIELEAKYGREWKEWSNRASRFIGSGRSDLESLGEKTAAAWRDNFLRVFRDDIVERVPLNGDHLRSIVEHLAQRKPPSSKGGEQFRDVALWLGLRDHFGAHPGRLPLAIVSNDSGFHGAEFKADLQKLGLDIRLFTDLQSFLSAEHKRVPPVGLILSGQRQVTGGSLTIADLNRGPRFTLEGDDFAFSNEGADPGNVNAVTECTLCNGGSLVSLGATFSGGFGLGYGPVRLLGKSFDRLYYSGAITFQGAVNVPVSGSNGQEVAVEAPFQFDGFIRGSVYGHMGPDPDTPIFDLHLAGSGTAQLNLIAVDDQPRGWLFLFNSLTYNFQP